MITNWENYPLINMSEFIIPTNGYQSFNDFFTRKFKPGMRTIDSPQKITQLSQVHVIVNYRIFIIIYQI